MKTGTAPGGGHDQEGNMTYSSAYGQMSPTETGGMSPPNAVNCIKGEIHNVLSVMRLNQRWASEARFKKEIPLQSETPLLRSFKTLHNYLQRLIDINDVDTVFYLQPFLDVISSKDTRYVQRTLQKS